MEQSKIKENFLLLLIVFAVLVGAMFRLNGLHRSLEYDEVWTFRHYVQIPFSQIFTDLATPNNHPLNTLFIQWSLCNDQSDFYQLRLPVLLFGIATILLTILFVWRTLKRKDAVFFAASCIAFNGYLIHYSQTARGYSIQSFFVLLTAAALYWLAQHKNSILYGAIFLFSAVCSCLTITSGLLFVCALCCAFAAVRIRKTDFKSLVKENLVFLIAALLFCVFAGSWYGINYSRIAAGQTFGTDVTHPWDFLKFVFEISTKLILFPFIFIHIAVLFLKKHPQKKISVSTLIFLCLCFLSALVTKAGSARVYLPMFPVAAISAAMVIPDAMVIFRKEKWTTPVFLISAILLALPINITWNSLRSPDYIPLMQEIMRDVEPDILVNFSVHDTYPMNCNVPESRDDFLKRIQSPHLKGFLQVNSPGVISVYDIQKQSAAIITPPSGPARTVQSETGTNIDYYVLQPLTLNDDPRGKILLAVILPQPEGMFAFFCQGVFSMETWYQANFSLTGELTSVRGAKLRYGLLICPSANYEAKYYLKITQLTRNNWRFYILR